MKNPRRLLADRYLDSLDLRYGVDSLLPGVLNKIE